VDLWVAVQPSHRREQLVLGRVAREVDLLRAHPDLSTGLVLGPEIDARCLVVADKNRGESWLGAAIHERHGALGDLRLDLRRDRPAVQDGGAHGAESYR